VKKLNKSNNFEPLHQKIRGIADSYAESKGLKLTHKEPIIPVDKGRGKKIADAYESMSHEPNNRDVKESYDALNKETVDQYNHIRNSGVGFSPIPEGSSNPYSNSKDMLSDLHENNHLWYYPTSSGFGSSESDSDHPLLQNVKTVDGDMKANDVFRAVHDFFGHGKEGHHFGPSGEDAAWKTHTQMYSPLAQKALSSETRGQNSWVNFGVHGEENRSNPKNTIYAKQKAGIMPEWTRDISKKETLRKSYHPAVHGGSHFIFSTENPKVKPKIQMTPESVISKLRASGEKVEETHGRYGSPEKSIIVHDPKNIDQLHNLAANLGQESAIVSNGGAHEMHYYAGMHAGKVRHGQGTQTFDQKPDDLYTKVSHPDNTHSYFQHNFDWDDKNLKSKLEKSNISEVVASALGDVNRERSSLRKYYGLMYGDKIEKHLEIRTKDRVFVSMDGDNIGASVERAAMANDLQTIMQQSKIITEGQRMIRQWAKAQDADIYIDGGDDIAFTLPADAVGSLNALRKLYGEKTGYTITIGVGDSISMAGHAMLFGKLRGKNQVNQWSPEIDEELERVSRTLSPEEKMQDHGLLGKMEDLEKAVAPPTRPGEISPDGRYVSKHHKGAGVQAWHYNPEISNSYDKFIDENKESFLAKHPPEHQKIVGDLIDSVRGDFNRHFVIGKDRRGSTDKIRARHIRGLMMGNDNYSLNVSSPTSLNLTAHVRHGSTPKSSSWNFSSNKAQVPGETADKGVVTSTGGHYVSKSDKVISGSISGRGKSLGYDQGSIYGISELVRCRRYYGVSRGSSSLAKSSQNLKLEHYSVQPNLDNIDPDHMGAGVGSRGRESKYGTPEPKFSFHYRAGTTPENVVVSQSKSKYNLELEPHHSIYDIGKDPDGIYKKLKEDSQGRQVNPGIVRMDEYRQAIKDAGHYGFYNSNHDSLSHAVALFYKHPAKEDTSFRKAEDLYGLRKNSESVKKLKEKYLKPAGLSSEDKIKNIKQSYLGVPETTRQNHTRRISEIKRQFKNRNENPQNDPLKVGAKIARQTMKKANPKTLDYSAINQIKQKPSAPKTLDYGKMAQIKQKPSAPKTLDYGNMSQSIPTPKITPPSPKRPELTTPVSDEHKQAKMAKYLRSKLKKPNLNSD